MNFVTLQSIGRAVLVTRILNRKCDVAAGWNSRDGKYTYLSTQTSNSLKLEDLEFDSAEKPDAIQDCCRLLQLAHAMNIWNTLK
jgi:hypothetical protein